MSDEIDRLMHLDSLKLSEQDLEGIVTYHRKARLNFISDGPKPKKRAQAAVAVGAKPFDLSTLVKAKPAAAPVKRRF